MGVGQDRARHGTPWINMEIASPAIQSLRCFFEHRQILWLPLRLPRKLDSCAGDPCNMDHVRPRVSPWLACAVLACVAGMAAQQAESTLPVFRSAIDLTTVTATVVDQKGQLVTGL